MIDCLIWGTPATSLPVFGCDAKTIDSSRAGGKYYISGTAESMLIDADDALKSRLTTWLIEQRERGSNFPEIQSITIEDSKHRKDSSIFDRVIGILKYLVRRSTTLGVSIIYELEDPKLIQHPLTVEQRTFFELLAHSECKTSGELTFLLEYLESNGLIVRHGINSLVQSCTVTVDGFRRLADELENSYIESPRAFVAMWFDSTMDNARECVKSAVELAGFTPILIDEKEHINRIDDEIISEIKRCRFLIADFTHGSDGVRGGVYYEAGFAHGLGIPVIFTCRRDEVSKLHFDTRQYNHLFWENPEELRDQLVNRITAVIGDGPANSIH